MNCPHCGAVRESWEELGISDPGKFFSSKEKWGKKSEPRTEKDYGSLVKAELIPAIAQKPSVKCHHCAKSVPPSQAFFDMEDSSIICPGCADRLGKQPVKPTPGHSPSTVPLIQHYMSKDRPIPAKVECLYCQEIVDADEAYVETDTGAVTCDDCLDELSEEP